MLMCIFCIDVFNIMCDCLSAYKSLILNKYRINIHFSEITCKGQWTVMFTIYLDAHKIISIYPMKRVQFGIMK